MIAIENTLVSEDILEKKFVCDLLSCKGACCVDGASGAPLEEEEIKILEQIFDEVKPYMEKDGVRAVEKQGFYVIDEDGDYTTPLIKGAQCAFVYFEENKIAKCAIEKAHKEGKVDPIAIGFKKPISCHLYPIRITKTKTYEALNYHKWKLCAPACKNGDELGVRVYEFLKAPLIRKYGEQWYEKIQQAGMIYEQGNP
jgi:hypothetical protein